MRFSYKSHSPYKKGRIMSDRIHLEIKGKMVELWFDIGDGKDAPCYYCGKPGFEQNMEVSMMYSDDHWAAKNSEMHILAEEEAKGKLLHGRAVCAGTWGEKSPCRNLYYRDREKNLMLDG